MTRSAKSVLYNGLILCLVFLAAMAVWYARSEIVIPFAIVFFGVVLPGAIQGFFWEDLFAGRRHLERGHWDKSIEHFQRFLTALNCRPWIRRLALLRLPRFTSSPKALVLNNMGLAFLNKGHKGKARKYFLEALKEDQHYGVPFFNLSVIALMEENPDSAMEYWSKAKKEGCARIPLDKLKPLADKIKSMSAPEDA